MNEQLKKIVFGILGVVVVVVGIVLFLTNDLEHIEDTNGADDYSLTTITDEDIIKMEMGTLGGPTISRSFFNIAGVSSNDGVEISAKKYTGVHEILYDDYLFASDFTLTIPSFTVSGGNVKLVVVHDDKIVETIEPGENITCSIEDVKGYISLRIAGESASYSICIDGFDYDLHSSN